MHAQVPSADCEAFDGGLLDQDANAWSSLAYVAVGVALLEALRRGRVRPAIAALAVAGIAEGVGSVLYHGAPGDGGQLVHDVALLALVAYLAGWHALRSRGRAVADRAAAWSALVASVVGTALHAVVPDLVNVGSALLVAVVVAGEVLGRRRGEEAVWSFGLVSLACLAAVTWTLGRGDSPVCDPTALTQPHATWHLLTAVLILGWADRTAGATASGRAGLLRDATDLVLGQAARLLVLAFHRRVDVIGRERLAFDGPTLVVANHGNGFVDPVVVAAVLGRLPRFVAKAALWRVLPARPFLALAGLIPVYRRGDGDDPSANRSSFAAVHDVLAAGGTVAIFPEGTTGDRASLDRVRTGAARMALGAAHDAPGLRVVPIGLAFESRVAPRPATAVVVGEPIAVGAWLDELGRPDAGEDDRPAVRGLTDRIRSALSAVSPEFASVDERELLRAAAAVAIRRGSPRRASLPFGDVEAVARRLAGATEQARRSVIDRYRTYVTRLSLVDLSDADLETRASARQAAPAVFAGLVVALAGPLVTTATLVHLPALFSVIVASGWVRSTATKGTVRLLVGAAAGIATWTIVGVVLADGWAAVAVGALVAVCGGVALLTWSTLLAALSRLWGRLRARGRPELAERARDDREELVAAIEAAIEVQPGGEPVGQSTSVPPAAP